MSLHLVVLCLAAFGVVAVAVSLAVGMALPLLDRLATILSWRHRAHLWLGVSSLPVVVGVFSLAASFLPTWGLAVDHCLEHGLHHPHICPEHLEGTPGLLVVFVASLVAFRALTSVLRLGRTVFLSHQTTRRLSEVARPEAGVFVYPSARPDAFVLGILRPRMFVSSGLLARGANFSEPVIAHERVHVRERDALWRILSEACGFGHLPIVIEAIRARFIAAQEFAADEDGAKMVTGGRLTMAEALVKFVQVTEAPAPGLSFTDGDVTARVKALLEAPPRLVHWPAFVLVVLAMALPLAVGLSHSFIHHALETVLGALS